MQGTCTMLAIEILTVVFYRAIAHKNSYFMHMGISLYSNLPTETEAISNKYSFKIKLKSQFPKHCLLSASSNPSCEVYV